MYKGLNLTNKYSFDKIDYMESIDEKVIVLVKY